MLARNRKEVGLTISPTKNTAMDQQQKTTVTKRLLEETPLMSWDVATLPDAVRVEEQGLVFDDRLEAIRTLFPAFRVIGSKPFIYIKNV